MAEHVRVGLRTRFLNALAQNSVGLVQTAATMALLVYGTILIGRGEITGGALMAAMTLIGRAVAPIAQGALMVGRIHQIRVAWAALAQLANAPQERPADADFVTARATAGRHRLRGRDLRLRPDAPPALKAVSFTIREGERVGLIGAIGCGKSTALKLMLKLHAPQTGRVLINGLAAEGIDPDWLRRNTAYVDQQPTLFSGTVRSNLTMHRPDCPDEALLKACQDAGALAWIGRLPRGFDTRLGERGAGLSAGQRQSLALARALIGAPRLIVMDEPPATWTAAARPTSCAASRRRRWPHPHPRHAPPGAAGAGGPADRLRKRAGDGRWAEAGGARPSGAALGPRAASAIMSGQPPSRLDRRLSAAPFWMHAPPPRWR